jgi:hypothetical protein
MLHEINCLGLTSLVILGNWPTWHTIPFYVFIFIFNSLHVSSTSSSSSGETNCINTTSGNCHCAHDTATDTEWQESLHDAGPTKCKILHLYVPYFWPNLVNVGTGDLHVMACSIYESRDSHTSERGCFPFLCIFRPIRTKIGTGYMPKYWISDYEFHENRHIESQTSLRGLKNYDPHYLHLFLDVGETR